MSEPLLLQPKPAAEGAPVDAKVSSRQRNRGFGSIAVAGLILLCGGIALYWSIDRKSHIGFVTKRISRGPVVRTVTTSGTVNPIITVQVGAYVSGVVQARYCDYNTEVKKGQICAKIDPRPYQAVVDQTRANLGVAKAQLVKDKANLAYTRVALERNQKLVVTKAVSQDVRDQSQSAYDQAVAQVGLDEATIALQEANLRAAEINLGYTDIIAPVDGTVVTRAVEMGQTVAASFQTPTLFLVGTDLTIMQVDANVSESDVGAIRTGDKASFTVESFPNRTFAGEVIQVRQSPQTIQNVVTYDVVVSAPNKDHALKPGMTATTRIVIDERADALRAPDQAFRYAPKGSAIEAPKEGSAKLWVLRDGAPQAVIVTLGLDDDVNTEILAGEAHEGDEAIIGEERRPSP
ncbi:efflux RND transporter periplasmic adaptor subunit [Methylocystis heyeri]|uniref:Efflux RND transporter periplasmic adaptor subunit n=1 Tax=Methylocystis heyeri TaxID=391905 RepID=A0A6B8KAF5_9HYPH|nr:efflux RND transporter periplasmic adaptor subunit [Methylocystis heyeri]QGM44442.1 efflux RND transporter periplasmic adaptor subunit [Methylocystis heyeri]